MMQLAMMSPVNPPKLKEKRKPTTKNKGVAQKKHPDQMVANQFKILMAVGMAMMEVLTVKYAFVSMSKPTMNMW
jgi:hypothetical protein